MSRNKLLNINKSFGRMLYHAVCILLIFTMLAVWSVSVVYAKYVASDNSDGYAHVAGVGVEIFNLVQRGQEIAGIDYSKVVPGVDIPGPHIQLKIKSEVSYTLYLKVTTRNCPMYITVDDEQIKVVYFDLTDDWECIKIVESGDYTTYTYKYVVGTANNEKNYVFKAGEEYTFVDANEIRILQGDLIYVSERYGELYRKNEDMSFSIQFEAYIQQVL